MYYLGIDIGSTSINTAIVNEHKELVYEGDYVRHFGLIYDETYKLINDIFKKYPQECFKGAVFTGTNGEIVANLIGLPFEVESICIVIGATNICPGVKSIISIGGQDAMLFTLSYDGDDFFLTDFSLNGPCASGTGSFIDQQAERLSHAIYGQDFELTQDKLDSVLEDFIKLGLKSTSPAPVACRCTVFTKSDMIHLQNKGEPLENIIAGLHYGNAQNFVSTIVGNIEVKSPVIFIGGMAANKMQVIALKKYFKDLYVPPHFSSIGAIGAAIFAMEHHHSEDFRFPIKGLKKIRSSLSFEFPRTFPLRLKLSRFNETNLPPILPRKKYHGYLGIDIGSTSTKYAFIDKDGKIITKSYVATRGKPIEVTQGLLKDLVTKLGKDNIEVLGICTTGSGRNVVGDFLDADLIVDEITAHSKGAITIDPLVDTIFEIGGQDSKYIHIKDTYPIDFDMNKVCAAGTGSFLHELANKLKINIVGEFQEIALSSDSPINLTERCTVFMESDLMGYAQKGAEIKDLIAGLCYSIVHNYLNRVVGKRYIGNKIMFLGGPSLNKAIVAAFERVLNKEIIVPPNREVMGAYGAALIVKDQIEKIGAEKKDRDIDTLSQVKVEFKETICRADPMCSNECKLKVYNFGGRKSVWGGDCGRYETTNQSNWIMFSNSLGVKSPCGSKDVKNPHSNFNTKGSTKDFVEQKWETKDYFSLRQDLFLDVLKKWDIEPGKFNNSKNSPTIGIPFGIHFLEWGFFWGIFFKELGFNVYLTPKTSSPIVKMGVESVVTEMCFPMKVYHGHVRYLKDKCDFLFLPNVIDMPALTDAEKSMFCPMVAASQYIVKTGLGLDDKRVLRPHVYLRDNRETIAHDMVSELKPKLDISYPNVLKVIEKAFLEYNEFKQRLYKIGEQVLSNADRPIWIITGRPYNLYDFRLNLHLGPRLAKRGILALPMDFVDISNIGLSDFPRMYWGLGSRILRCAKYIKTNLRVFGVHITNFSCGADSFIEHFYKHILSDKPYLILEFDEHSGVAGMLTRIEAFNHVVYSVISH